MNIELCVPAVADGIHCLDFYLQNLRSLASQPVKVTVSYHTDHDLAAILAMKNQPEKTIQATSYSKGPFLASANHSSAINALARQAMGDIVIFSDYDMAFLKKGWDDDIREILKTHDFFGIPYAPIELGFSKILPMDSRHGSPCRRCGSIKGFLTLGSLRSALLHCTGFWMMVL